MRKLRRENFAGQVYCACLVCSCGFSRSRAVDTRDKRWSVPEATSTDHFGTILNVRELANGQIQRNAACPSITSTRIGLRLNPLSGWQRRPLRGQPTLLARNADGFEDTTAQRLPCRFESGWAEHTSAVAGSRSVRATTYNIPCCRCRYGQYNCGPSFFPGELLRTCRTTPITVAKTLLSESRLTSLTTALCPGLRRHHRTAAAVAAPHQLLHRVMTAPQTANAWPEQRCSAMD